VLFRSREFLVRRTCLSGSVKEKVVRKKHAPAEEERRTLCGHETTVQEYQKMRGRKATKINCKHCLQVLGRL